MCWEDLFNNGLRLRSDTLINVWSGGWEWCQKQTSGSSVVRSNETCSKEYGSGGPVQHYHDLGRICKLPHRLE